jgi:hypothetical protein
MNAPSLAARYLLSVLTYEVPSHKEENKKQKQKKTSNSNALNITLPN